MTSKRSLTIVQMNDSHAYFDLHHELFWQGDHALYRPAGGYARITTIVKQIRDESKGNILFCDCGDFKQRVADRYYTTAFVTPHGVPHKYGINRENSSEHIIGALRTYLARHRPIHTELRGTFVAV